MAENAKETAIAHTGSIKSAPFGAAFLYGYNTAKPTGTVDHGLANSDGVSITKSNNTTVIMAWQDDEEVRETSTEAYIDYTFGLLQFVNDDNMELAFGVTKNATTGGWHWDASKRGDWKQFFIEAIDKENNFQILYWLPKGRVQEIADITVNSQGIMTLTLTIRARKIEVEGQDANTVIFKGLWRDEDEADGSATTLSNAGN